MDVHSSDDPDRRAIMLELLVALLGIVLGFKIQPPENRARTEWFIGVYFAFVFVTLAYIDLPPLVGIVTPIPGTTWATGRLLVWALSGALFVGFLVGNVVRWTFYRLKWANVPPSNSE